MNLFTSILLGILQGLTEFLPVSSSGHLVIVQQFIPNFDQPGVLFDTVLHAGTFFSVLFYFRKKIVRLSFRYLGLLGIGTIPAVIFGFLFQDLLESLFTNLKIVGITLILTGAMNYFTDRLNTRKEKISKKDSLFIGFFQAVAIIPGISRSGSTIFSGAMRGISKTKAAEFSFLLSIPAVLGANLLQIFSYQETINLSLNYLTGLVSAFVSGYLAIFLVYRFLISGKFKIFAYYTFALGMIVLLLSY